MKFNERLSEAISKSHKERQVIAQEVGISRPTLNKYCEGDSEPKVTELSALIQTLGINPRWLITGVGNMHDIEPVDVVLEIFNELKLIKHEISKIKDNV
jgi:transcriptional regulator with XRE-family HTH domain